MAEYPAFATVNPVFTHEVKIVKRYVEFYSFYVENGTRWSSMPFVDRNQENFSFLNEIFCFFHAQGSHD